MYYTLADRRFYKYEKGKKAGNCVNRSIVEGIRNVDMENFKNITDGIQNH